MAQETEGKPTQEVLLVGGPRHGETVELPYGQTSWETSITDGVNFQAHTYRLDERLSRTDLGRPISFTHSVLWNTPNKDGINSSALREAEKRILELVETVDALDDATVAAHARIQEFQDKYEALLKVNASAVDQLAAVRTCLEIAGINLAAAVQATGCDYQPLWKS